MKTCYQCQQTKEDSEFYRDFRSDDLLTSSCKDCQKARARERYKKVQLTDVEKAKKAEDFQKWKKNNPEKYKELMRKNNKKRKNVSD